MAEREALRRLADELQDAWWEERQAQAGLLRDIVGNPFSSTTLNPAWRTATALALARAADEGRLPLSGELDSPRLAVLSDALEEAGCSDEALLGHLRSAGPHVPGCWAVRLILGEE
jgi:hypothetical protein